MKFAITLLAVTLSLSGCAGVCSDHNLASVAPAIRKYPQSVLNQAADEIDGGKCPTLGDVMMPDYFVCRQQSRAIK